MSRSNLVGLLPSELEDLAVTLGASRYRGRQLATWIYRKAAVDLEAMTDLPKDFRARLAETHDIALPDIERVTPSQDGSRKLVFRLADERRVSAGVMPDARLGIGYPPRRITVSTVGLVAGIDRLGREDLKVNLAVSLHAASDEVRERLMPINRSWNLEALMAAVRRYPLTSRQRVFFEYVMLEDVNDSAEDARRLARLLRGVPAKVNLIPFNDWPGAAFHRPPLPRILAFQGVLLDAGVTTTVRWSKGEDIGAACGQLKEPVVA